MATIQIKQLKDKDEDFFPVTHERAVRDDNGNTLESKLAAVIEDAKAVLDDGAVRTDVAQSLTDTEKSQALANLGIGGIDDKPTAGSDNLIKSGGVQSELALGAVYDVSAKNPTAGPNNDGKWESLSALLSDANLNTLIPTAVRKGGMSIKFIQGNAQSSDNKYVQYRYTGIVVSGNPNPFLDIRNWEKVVNSEQEIDILNSDITAVNSLIVSQISLTSLNTLNLFIDGGNKYDLGGNARCVIISVNYLVGQKLTIEYPSTAVTKAFAFLKSLDGIDTDRSTPDFCTGTVRLNQGTYTVPNDCHFILFNLSPASSLSIFYPSVTVNGSVDERLSDLENFVYEAIDVTESTLYDIAISSNGKWESDGIRKSILLNVSTYINRTIKIEYDSYFAAGFVSFLKTNTIGEAGELVTNFCDNYPQRYSSGTFVIPTDCNYILMQVVSASGMSNYPTISLYNEQYNELGKLLRSLNWDGISLTDKVIGYSLKWETNNVSKGAIVDASDYKNKYIDVQYNDTFSAPFIIFLKSTAGNVGDTVDYCNGCDERYRSGLYKVPNDCNYIFFYITNVSNVSYYPKVLIYGDIFKELGKELEKITPDAWTINPLHLKFDEMIDHDAYPSTEINNLSGKKMEYLYNHYDALMAAYPQYITKINLDDLSGINEDEDTLKHAPYDVTEYPCYAYKFTPNYNYPIVGGQQAAKLPRIMCATGRGADSTNIISAMRMMEDICGHWREHEGLEQLRFGCEIIFVPCVSPWEMANNTGRNINGVNLNRNFDTGPYSPWQYEVDPSTGLAVSGPYADSEYETRLMEFTLMYFKPDCFFSFQTTDITNDYPIVGGSVLYCSDDNYRRVLLNVASEITRKELKKYAEDFTVPGETHLNISDDQLLMFPHKYESYQYGRMTLWAYLHLGIELCGSLDISDGFLWHDGVLNTENPRNDYGNAKGMTIQTHVDTITMLRALQRLLLKV